MSTLRTDSVLDAIVERKREDLVDEMRVSPLASVRAAASSAPRGADFGAALLGGAARQTDPSSRASLPIRIIAEIKRASPSKGVLAGDVDPAAVARLYAEGGADGISVLTERHRFLGSLEDLQAVRRAVDVPLLRKDFLFDPYHLYQARAAGADAALLIVAMLEQSALVDLMRLAGELGLTALVEVHTGAELERAIAADARVIGINNRDLHTFQVDLAVTERLAPRVPVGCTIVGESGVFTAADVERLRATGVHALLVGEALMRAGLDRVADKIGELKGRAVPA
jgi:indole-3-glycerol phosphate synthase